jgi:nicotinate phosphoribosyltransferase
MSARRKQMTNTASPTPSVKPDSQSFYSGETARGILDNDLYKFTMQQAVLALYPDAQVTYKFINRRPSDKFTKTALVALRERIKGMENLSLSVEEREFLEENCPFLTTQYLEYLSNFRFDASQVSFKGVGDEADSKGSLELTINGPWHSTILWEVPLMALISEVYFEYVDTDWNDDGQEEKLEIKASDLSMCGLSWACFSTRRRRNYESQCRVVDIHKNHPGFAGTSNVHLAMRYGVKPIGTQAHEWIMGHSVLCGLRHANRYALQAWNDVYKGDLGIALTDTYGSEAFFGDFDGELARMYDGVRHDSGDPLEFADKVISHYESLRMDPKSKVIVFSDGLDAEEAVRIYDHVDGRIKVAFGIGTNFSNDYGDSKPLNIVIKLTHLDGVPVVKLSDDPGKATGDPEAVRVAKWTFLGESLDG